MNSVLKWGLAPIVAVALLSFADTEQAKAQFGISIGVGNGFNSGYGGYQSIYHRPVPGVYVAPRTSYYGSGYSRSLYRSPYAAPVYRSYHYAPRPSVYGISRIQPAFVPAPRYGTRRVCF